ncbi:ABC transporter permease [Mucilaginibacter segetis]|uniref:ABC transporter permease n=1 Tax=Mucilaginibacter segetis TaxID=2793071 RepID=A0A934PUG1_9SPHI|nr:ABC transporter permease [Mucilaginibacter segetis]MBK0381064.1 ABC transporter permease [Mucilaginibacter segetis]
MIKNYFKIAWRNLWKNKAYSLINIGGLTAGIAVALLIGLWVSYQYSYDKFLPNYGQSYQVRRNFNSNGDTLTFSTTSLKLADALRNGYPEIEYVAEADENRAHGLAVGDTKLSLDGIQAGSDFLKIFRFPFLQGNANGLRDPYSIIITESTAKALFGNKDAMNQLIKVDNKDNLKVTGIIKDIPSNSSLQFNYIIPFSYFEIADPGVKEARNQSFGSNGFVLYAKLKDGIKYKQIAPKIKNLEKYEDNLNAKNSDVIMQPIQDWHLYNTYTNGKALGGFINYVRTFSIIGILVLVIACINFVNLTTARSEKRAREVGIRKAIGSKRKQLIVQFLTESILITFIALFFALLLVQLVLPSFRLLTGNSITIPFNRFYFWLIVTGAAFATAILAGSRPAFYLSSFNPVQVLKGTLKTASGAIFSRKALVVIQFSCSIALIISTVIIYQQIQYAKNRPTGYTLNRLVTTITNSDLRRNMDALKNDLLQSGAVSSLTTASSPATGVWWHSDVENFPGKNTGETVEMGTILVSADYFKTLGMQLKAGHDFVNDIKADSNSVILNEAAVKRLRLKEPLGQYITKFGRRMTIIGVVKDALMDSPFQSADPTMFFFDGGSNIIYRLSPNINTHQAIDKIAAIFNKYSPAYQYTYHFVDEDYNKKFNLEVLVGKLAGIFAGLAIFISCLGLFGLAAYVAEQRTKEIGVRKVLGATVTQVWILLSKDFIVLVIVSCIIASPIALYFLQNWLYKYAYRISIGPEVFVLSAIAAIIITLATISFQAIKAAIANPVKSLRSE